MNSVQDISHTFTYYKGGFRKHVPKEFVLEKRCMVEFNISTQTVDKGGGLACWLNVVCLVRER